MAGPMNENITLESLAAMPDALERMMATFPEAYLTWTPESWEGIPGERFSLLGQVCHLRDIEIDGYHVRFRRMLQEERPDLVSLDSYELAAERNYDLTPDLDAAYRAFRSAREKTVEMLRNVSENDLRRRGTFAEYGEITLEGLIHFLCSHDQQHLACIQWLLGKISGMAPGC